MSFSGPVRWVLIALTFALDACGAAAVAPHPDNLLREVTPSTTTATINSTANFSALGGQSPYSWVVSAGSGSITSTGAYTAPSTTGSATISLTDGTGAHVSATVTVILPRAISPASITMPASSGSSFPFSGVNGAGGYSFD